MFLCANLSSSPLLCPCTHQKHTRALPNSSVSRQVAACAELQNGDGGGNGIEQPQQPSAVSSAFERAAAYRKSLGKAPSSPSSQIRTVKAEPNTDPQDSAKEEMSTGAEDSKPPDAEDLVLGFKYRRGKPESKMVAAADNQEARQAGRGEDEPSQGIEVEIVTRDGVIRRKVSKPGATFSTANESARKGISSSDFMGLDFSEKKSKGGLPAGLAAGFESPPPGSLPEVEIITRDGSAQQLSKDGLYKPKVVTWGVFERPADISRTYGGGRTIKPGEQLLTKEEKQARDDRTKELLASYYKKAGLDVDPQIKAECIKVLKQGNELFDNGYFQGAVEQFKRVMQKMPYQSELYGLAALQMALCFDSSNRFKEAKEVYEKVVSHPNATVRKKAKQFLYGFQAMENLKVSTASRWDTSVYRKYFDSFSDGYNNMYKPSEEEVDEGRMREQAFLYIGVLAFPLVLLLIVIALKGS